MHPVPIIATNEKYEGLSPIDSRTPLVALVGVLGGAFGISRSSMALTVLGVEAGYAMLTEQNGLFAEQSGDSYGNRIVDLVVGFAGYEVGRRIRNTTDGKVDSSVAGLGSVHLRRGVGFAFFGEDCKTDHDAFDRYSRARIYPGSWNRWLIAKNPDKGSGTVEKFMHDILLDVDDSWFSSPTTAITPVADWATFNQMLVDEGNGAKVEKVSTSLSPPPKMDTPKPDYYFVVFKAPADAPIDIAWPVLGCVEDAEWSLTAIATPWSQKQVDGMVKTAESKGVVSTPTSPDKVLEANKIAASLSKLPSGTLTNTSTGKSSVPLWLWWALGGTVAVAGGAYVYSRKRR